MMNSNKILVALALLLGSGLAVAQDAGTVNFVSGTVTAERQPPVALARGDKVVQADTVVTLAASRAQILMIDGARLAIRPNSRIVIEEYVHAAAADSSGTVISSSDDSSVLRLVKGGFRSITGAIGKETPENYEVRTPVGVLGIRGTDFALLFCVGDCATAPGVGAGAVVPDGLYIRVSDGSIEFSNEVATIIVSAGEFAFIPLETRRPERLDMAPPVFIDAEAWQFEADQAAADSRQPGAGDAAPSGFDSKLGTRRTPDDQPPDSSAPGAGEQQGDEADRATPQQSIIGIDPDGSQIDLTPGGTPDPNNRTISYSTGPLGPADPGFSGTAGNMPGQFSTDTGNNLTGFTNLYPARTGAGNASFGLGSASNVDTGFDSMTVLRWGRWAGGTASITTADGSDASQDLGNQSLHWISSPGFSDPPVLPIAGQASYALVGATAPTDNRGNAGILGNATLQADFTAMIVQSTLNIDIAGSNWTAIGAGGIGPAAQLPAELFGGAYSEVIVDGIGGGAGSFSGFFSGPGPASDPSLPGGAGLTYSLVDMGGTISVSGAAAFGNP